MLSSRSILFGVYSADGAELAVRAVLGQQISVAGARTLAGEMVTRCGQPLPLADGEIVLDPVADREETGRRLVAPRRIGPWTASYVTKQALGDPDAFLPTDLGVRRALARLGQASDPAGGAAFAERWRPWRAYAVQHLWAAQDQMPMIKQRETRKEVVA